MLTGQFGDTTGCPYLEGQLSLPRFALSAAVSFIIDTGADSSVLMPLDGIRIGLNYADLTNPKQFMGFGGSGVGFVEPAVVAFTDGIAIFLYEISILIVKPKRSLTKIPSVLGRDILNKLIIRYDYPNGRIEMHNHTADHIIPVPSDKEEIAANNHKNRRAASPTSLR